jgi:phosphocarrier protein HPr
MKTFTWSIRDQYGLHARPVGLLVKMASQFPCKSFVAKDDKAADCKRLFSVMSLAAKCGQTLVFSFEGEEEEQACRMLKAFYEENL